MITMIDKTCQDKHYIIMSDVLLFNYLGLPNSSSEFCEITMINLSVNYQAQYKLQLKPELKAS